MKKIFNLSLIGLAIAALAVTNLGQKQPWQPATAGELQMTKAVVESDADAEALLWDVYVSDEDAGMSLQTVLRHYVKVKIFNDRGKEAFSKIDIHFGKIDGIGFDVRIKDIAARTTKPDGTIVELKSSDIFDRDVIKGNGVKLKARSFAVPGIEAGAVIEYKWTEVRGAVSYYQRLQFAREIPVQLVRYHIRPVAGNVTDLRMSVESFNVKNTPFVREGDNFYTTTASNIPAFREEPRMPPEYAVRPWLLLYYGKAGKIEENKFWRDYGKREFEAHKGLMKSSEEVKAATAEAVGSETDGEKRLQKIFDYVRSRIKNYNDDAMNLTAEQLKKIKENKSPSDTLKRGQGNLHDINMLFAAMATAAGFEARVANLPRRSDIFFPKWFTNDYFMRTENIAVKVGDKWRFFDPGSLYIPYGMLRWEEEGVPALVSDSREPVWEVTPMSAPERTMEKRTGSFKLLEDGTLEGSVRMEFTGQLAAVHKEYNDDDSQQQREDTLKSLVRENILGSAEISDIKIENVADPEKPFVYAFKLRVPGYASRTGKRIFLQPNVFERSVKPLFENGGRRYEVYFEYPYSERDEITIDLPAGYELESPDKPAPLRDSSGISSDEIQIGVSADKCSLVYKRSFMFGGGGNLRFQTGSYLALKKLFEAFHRANTHSMTLRQTAATAKQ